MNPFCTARAFGVGLLFCASALFVSAQPGTTTRASVSSSGEQEDKSSEYPSISADGRFVAFDSGAGNLVPGDTNGKEDVFIRDRLLGTTERVSISSSGEQGNGGGYLPSISADGRFVAFGSDASNLVPATRTNTMTFSCGTGSWGRRSACRCPRAGSKETM